MTTTRVRAMNHISGRGVVLAAEGYVAFELLEGGIVDGDEVDGDFTSHGACVWRNLTTGKDVKVYVHKLMVEPSYRYAPSPAP